MRTVQIDRRAGLDSAAFAREYLAGTGTPVIVSDATDQWAARTKWTFDFFKSAYGADLVCPSLGIYGDIVNVTKLSTYIDWLATPDAELDGFWMEKTTRRPVPSPPRTLESPPYLIEQNAFENHPDLFGDITPPMYFVDDWTLALSEPVRKHFETVAGKTYWGILLGPEGSMSRLHRDFQHTHSWLAQIQGRKRATLFAPDDLDRANAYEGVLGPGDVLFTPGDWWHEVRAVDASITVAHNFFNKNNFSAYMGDFLAKVAESRQAPK